MSSGYCQVPIPKTVYFTVRKNIFLCRELTIISIGKTRYIA